SWIPRPHFRRRLRTRRRHTRAPRSWPRSGSAASLSSARIVASASRSCPKLRQTEGRVPARLRASTHIVGLLLTQTRLGARRESPAARPLTREDALRPAYRCSGAHAFMRLRARSPCSELQARTERGNDGQARDRATLAEVGAVIVGLHVARVVDVLDGQVEFQKQVLEGPLLVDAEVQLMKERQAIRVHGPFKRDPVVVRG